MKTPGRVTIMVPVLNGELFLPLALDSLLAQDYQHFEIVILDNQSTDRTAEICRAYACRDPRVRYVMDTVNRISHDAANHLGTFIDGEFCMIACDDDLWTPNFLSVLVKYLQLHPDVGLVFPNAYYVDVEGACGRQRLLVKAAPLCARRFIPGEGVALSRATPGCPDDLRSLPERSVPALPCRSTRSMKRLPM